MTFDVVADLLFGEPFGCLQVRKKTPKFEPLLQGGDVWLIILVFTRISPHTNTSTCYSNLSRDSALVSWYRTTHYLLHTWSSTNLSSSSVHRRILPHRKIPGQSHRRPKNDRRPKRLHELGQRSSIEAFGQRDRSTRFHDVHYIAQWRKGNDIIKRPTRFECEFDLDGGFRDNSDVAFGCDVFGESYKNSLPFLYIPNQREKKKKKKTKTNPLLLLLLLQKLLKNPSKLTLLTREIRSTWPTYSSITLSAVNNSAPYLIAVLNESLRYFPPVPTGFERRISQPGGEVISGVFIPEGTAVQVSQWAAHHSEENFADPELFVPERWLDGEDGMGDDGDGKGKKWKREEKYEGDRRGAMQPFSFGPRNCLGKVS